MSPLPTLSEERRLWHKGYWLVIGIDEVGRGAFAGPIVVSACALIPQDQKAKSKSQNMDFEKIGINDSKKLSPSNRQQLAKLIKQHSLAWSVAEVGVTTINRMGIGKATFMAMRKAVAAIMRHDLAMSLRSADEAGKQSRLSRGLPRSPASREKRGPRNDRVIILPQKVFLLVDAFHIKYVKGIGLQHQKAIVKGDQKVISIAAASILAKVHRDRIMRKLHKKYGKYGWHRNKGYGTKDHQTAIKKHGLTKQHRKQFVETWVSKSKFKVQKSKPSAKSKNNPVFQF